MNNDIDVICMSESWERYDNSVETLLKIENFEVISNFHQRKGRGGRPLVIANSKKYIIQNLTNTVIEIPWGVEIVWVLLTPKEILSNNMIKKNSSAACIQQPIVKTKQNSWIMSQKHIIFCPPNTRKGCFGYWQVILMN